MCNKYVGTFVKKNEKYKENQANEKLRRQCLIPGKQQQKTFQERKCNHDVLLD